MGVRQCRVPLLYYFPLTCQISHQLSRLRPTQKAAPFLHLVGREFVIPVHEASEGLESEYALAVAKRSRQKLPRVPFGWVSSTPNLQRHWHLEKMNHMDLDMRNHWCPCCANICDSLRTEFQQRRNPAKCALPKQSRAYIQILQPKNSEPIARLETFGADLFATIPVQTWLTMAH